MNAAHEQGHASATTGLSDRDREIIAFERWWKYAGAKEQAIRELFDMSATRYYQVLNTLIDNPAALEADPMLVKRLRRLRASRQRARSAKRLGINGPSPRSPTARAGSAARGRASRPARTGPWVGPWVPRRQRSARQAAHAAHAPGARA